MFLFRHKLKDHFLSVKKLKKFDYNYITVNKKTRNIFIIKILIWKNFKQNKKIFKKSFSTVNKKPKKAFINSLILNFILDYEFYLQIFKRFDTKF